MSGTSCDGIDVALVDIGSESVHSIATYYQPYPKQLKNELLAVIAGTPLAANGFAKLDCQLAECYASAIKKTLIKSGYDAQQIKAIGLHGQTIDHQPPINTWQLGSAAHVAALTGIDVIADFRSLDVAMGGQGAPLAPALHKEIFFQGTPVAVLNLGGIANMSYLTAERVIGFDTGPANCLMDLWVSLHLQQAHDDSGQWAATGSVNELLLKAFMSEPYFSKQPPKSTGRELFNQDWLNQHLVSYSDVSAEDVQATLLALTSKTIKQDIERYAPQASRLIVCGGGVHNLVLMNQLKEQLNIPVINSMELGIDPDHVESVLMAWLASKYNSQLDLRQITGAEKIHQFGVLYSA